MPNVLLKNEVGEDVAYNDIDSVTLRKVEGGTATFTFQNPKPTDAWKLVEGIVSGDGRTSLYAKYTLPVPSGKIVSYSEPSFGTWYQSRYDARRISTTMMNQLYAVPGGAILASSVNGGKIYYWDDDNRELNEISSNASPIHNFREYGGKYFIAAYRGWYLFDAQAKELTSILEGTNMPAFCLDTGEELLLSVSNNSSTNPKGIYRLDPNTFELTQLFDEGWYWLGAFRPYKGITQTAQFVQEVPGGYLFGGYTAASQSTGVLYYDTDAKTVTRLCANGYYYFNESLYTRYAYNSWTHIIEGYGIVFSSSQSTAWGVWYYDYASKEITQIMQTGYANYWMENDSMVLGSYSSFGAVVFDKKTKTWYHPVPTGQYDNAAILENGILLGCSSSSYGLKYYDFATETASVISTAYNYWRYMAAVDGGALLSNATANSGIFFFDETEKTLTQLTTTGSEWYMVKWQDSVLMGSFNSSVYGWFYYKNGELTYNAGIDSNHRSMRCIAAVEDGWVISSYNYSSRVMFIDGETGEAKDLGFNSSQIGIYMPYWYGHGGVWKPAFDYNRKYGRYRVLSTYDGNGCIFDDIAHEVLPLVYWNNTSDQPTPTSYVRYTYMRRVSFTELGNNAVLIVCGSSSNSGAVFLNYATGTAYLFTGASLYAYNEYSYWFTPLIEQIAVGNGILLYVKPFDWSEYPGSVTSAAGVWHYDPSTDRLRRIYTAGYYDSVEEAPGGFYLYLSSLPVECRLYWNSESNTLTKVDY